MSFYGPSQIKNRKMALLIRNAEGFLSFPTYGRVPASGELSDGQNTVGPSVSHRIIATIKSKRVVVSPPSVGDLKTSKARKILVYEASFDNFC